MLREVAGGDLCETCLGPPDGIDERLRDDEAEQEREHDAGRTDTDRQVSRGAVRAALLRKERIGWRPGRRGETIGASAEIVIGVDHVGEERLDPTARRAGSVESD